MSQITVYISSNCPYCQRVLDYFASEMIEPRVKNISEDQQAYAEWKAINPIGTPLTCVGDNHVVGANKKKLAEIANSSGDNV
ncbi:glutaredoxin family protein [Salisediminibacterium halotolerans]|uniref:Glutaredoxin n=1 Tax=Salisediminibacterium halotolerans TaxID=517425 RepID=A0A1H9WLT0_9BACI|nr:glutaredoxin family protein [Salisediminibacterium haloalkalitolerans]SES34848.1 Glutaredoxin [Salisediminibacterium haloalkalitolerans]